MAKTCNASECNNPVFSKGFCRNHQYLRTDGKAPTPINRSSVKKSNNYTNSTKSVTPFVSRKVRKKIKNSSTKRSSENALYEQAKINVRNKLQKEDNWKCFFSCLVLPDEFNEFHHLMDKHGELLYDENNIRPAIRGFHNDYHQKTVEYLLEQKWYVDFLVRIKEEFPEVWGKEQRRINKR